MVGPVRRPPARHRTARGHFGRWEITLRRGTAEALADRGGEDVKIQSVKLACFSPTGTTNAVLRGVARGLGQGSGELIDLTKPDARRQPLRTQEDELLVVGVPVYMGRVPALLTDWLEAIQARNTPVVCVVVYGNRAYEDALLELGNVLTSRGGIPIAGAAFVGEHSFSSSGLPIAAGRPDSRDLHRAEDFGRRVWDKLQSVSAPDDLKGVDLPGSFPYGGITELWSVDFIEVSEECTQCGICAEVCPVDAIDSKNSRVIDTEECFTCCACIKNCPEGARTMKAGPVLDAAVRLNALFADRKEPVLFL